MQRIKVIDFLRGIAMVLMPLDHVRDFLSNSLYSPTDLQHTTPALFFTRLLVNFCAPIFIFLAGISMFLWKSTGKTKKEVSYFLFTRGLFLILMEFTIIRTVWAFNFDLSFQLGQIFWAIGWSMIALSIIIYLPYLLIGIIGLIIIFTDNIFSKFDPSSWGSLSWLFKIFYGPGEAQIRISKIFTLQIEDPIIPWIGVILLGYFFGKVYTFESIKRKKSLLIISLVFLAIFVIFRFINYYGDPQPWIVGDNILLSLMSFVNCEKYPPSLDYILFYLGIAIFILYLFDNVHNKFSNFFIIFGKVPFGYYVVHVFLIHLIAIILALITYRKAFWLFNNHNLIGGITSDFPIGYGYDLFVVYIIWIIVVLLLYFFCKWYGKIKQKYKNIKFFKYI